MDRWSRFLENTCAPERFSLAKARAAKLVHHIAPLFLMHEANAVIIYSQQLSEQIPRSYAAHAFNQFQHSMHLFEIIRLCAIWDKPNPDRESIPTIIALFNTPELIDQLVTEVRASYANAPPGKFYDGDDAQEMATKKSWWKRERETIIRQVEKVTRDKLSFAVGKAAEIQQSSRLKRLVQFRDRYIAHNLDIAQPAMSDEASVKHPAPFTRDSPSELSIGTDRGQSHVGTPGPYGRGAPSKRKAPERQPHRPSLSRGMRQANCWSRSAPTSTWTLSAKLLIRCPWAIGDETPRRGKTRKNGLRRLVTFIGELPPVTPKKGSPDMQPMDPKRVKDLLVQAKKLGMTDRSFQLIHHLSRRGTHLETVSGMMAYCDKHEAFEIDNQRVGHRLDYVLRGYREFQEFNFPIGEKHEVFNALAEAAWLGIPPLHG
jgi:AbiU2